MKKKERPIAEDEVEENKLFIKALSHKCEDGKLSDWEMTSK